MSLIVTWRNPSSFHTVFYSWIYLNSSATDVASNLKFKVLCIFAWFSSVASIATEIKGNCRYSVCCMTFSLWNGNTHGFSCSKHQSIFPSYLSAKRLLTPCLPYEMRTCCGFSQCSLLAQLTSYQELISLHFYSEFIVSEIFFSIQRHTC